MDVLISGSGVAGPCLAWWLRRQGHRVTLLEKAKEPRFGGYIIDFWGKGYDIAEEMGLLPRIEDAGYHVEEVALLDADGRRVGGFGGKVFGRISGGRYISLPRGELSRALFEAVEHDVETMFGEEIESIEHTSDGVTVGFSRSEPRHFDIVIGAEGLHSRTRELIFGSEDRFERFMGYSFAAFTIPGYAARSPDVYVIYGEPGRSILRFAQDDGSTLILLIWKDAAHLPLPHDRAGEVALLKGKFGDAGWEVPDMLARLDDAKDVYLDRVSQIRMPQWHRDRVALVGDAAYGPSFLAGQGAALAMIGAYVLAGELGRAASPEEAFSAYQTRLFDFMAGKQDAAGRFASTFVPSTRLGLKVRSLVSHVLDIDWVADRVFGTEFRDQIDLPRY